MSGFPRIRLRRMRSNNKIRKLSQETKLSIENLVCPMFVRHGRNVTEPIASMPGCNRFSVDNIGQEAMEIAALGIQAIILFGIPSTKDALGHGAFDHQGIVQEAIKAIKNATPDLLVITDVCLCEYTDHGHCGIFKDDKVDNDQTLALLAQTALSHAVAGADIVAPSAMMDGQVKAIREKLDTGGYQNIPIISYAAKYASAFYGPFRMAAESSPKVGDRLGYQMDPANWRMAMREIESDIQEGADVVMIKPALPYLDVIAKARERFDVPIAAFNVSGEFSMVKAASGNQWIDNDLVALEILTAIKRAGADIIFTYHAKEFATSILARHIN